MEFSSKMSNDKRLAGCSWSWGFEVVVYLAGFAGQLCLTIPLWLGYLRVRPYELSTAPHIAALAAIALQLIVVGRRFVGDGLWTGIKESCATLSIPTRCAILAVFCLTSTHLTLLIPRWGEEGTVLLLIMRVGAAGVLAAANALSLWQAGRCVPQFLKTPSPTLLRRLPYLTAIGVLLVTGVMSNGVYEGLPHIPDEAAYLFQAECLADGLLEAEAPAVPKAFNIYLIESKDGGWRAVTNPGWPALLSVGVRFGLTNWINPLLAAACVLLLHSFMRRIGDTSTANVAVVLLASSPWFLFLAASLMTHILTLFLLLGALSLMVRQEPRHTTTLLAGLLLGWLFTVRPLDGLLAGISIFTAGLWTGRLKLTTALTFCFGCLMTGGLLLWFNHTLTGTIATTPVNDYIDRLWYPGANRLGFGADVGNPTGGWGLLDPYEGHGWRDVLLNLNQNAYNLNFEFLGCGAGSLCLLVVHWAFGQWDRRDRLAAGALAATAILYSTYWFSGGPDFGARYWFPMLPPLLWLSARGFATIRDRTINRERIRVAVMVSIIATLCLFVPWRCLTKYHDYRGVTTDIRHAYEEGQFAHAIVLIDDTELSGALYRSAFFLNAPTLPDSRPVFARDRGPASHARLRAAYPDRELLRWTGSGCEPVH